MTHYEKNFLIQQYQDTGRLSINHNYLYDQFADSDAIFDEIRELVVRGDFTLGEAVRDFEAQFAEVSGTKHAIGVGSGTDALFLSLKAKGIQDGDEVITSPYTFYATIGAIVTAGGKPVFADIGADYNIDPVEIEKVITPKTRAIVPIHWSGLICDMPAISAIADKYNLAIVEDACHAIGALRHGHTAGTFADTACYSMHPLKNLNVWGDGGVIVTNDDELARKLSLMRNHGLVNRDTCEMFAYNSRLDTLQAIVAKHLLKKIDHITDSRIGNAAYFDRELMDIEGITMPPRDADAKQVFHIYVLRCERRDELVTYLIDHDIDAKIHYPTPMHLQPAAATFQYQKGDFPIAEATCDSVFSLPVHEFITNDQRQHVVDTIREFFAA